MKQILIFITSLTIVLSLSYQNVFAWEIDYNEESNFPLPPHPNNEDMKFETGTVIVGQGLVSGMFAAWEDDDVIAYNMINGRNSEVDNSWYQEIWLVSTHQFDYQVFWRSIWQTVGQMSWDGGWQQQTYTTRYHMTIDDIEYHYVQITMPYLREYEVLFGQFDTVTETRLTAREVLPLVLESATIPQGSYDSTIPYFTDSSFSLTVTDRALEGNYVLPATYPVVSGLLMSTLSNNTNYDSSQYVIDYNWHASYTRYKAFLIDGNEGGTTKQTLYGYYNGNTSLNLNVCNPALLEQAQSLDGWNEPAHGFGYSYSTRLYKLSVAIRLRDKTTGNYGPSYTVTYDNLMRLDWRDYKKTSGVVGVTDNVNPSNNNESQIFNNDLSEIVEGDLSYNGTNMGTSRNQGVLVNGGGYVPQADISIFSTTFGQVPQIFGAVLSFFPAWVLQFVATAFVTCIAIAIVKAIL